ncbi:MAG: TIGR02300 family protein [Hyphomicrobium sp.]
MSTKQARGTKRTCQSNECGIRFYDLNRNPISCPVCGTIYQIASSPVALNAVAEDRSPRKVKKPDYPVEKAAVPDGVPEAEGDEVLADIEAGDDEIAPEAEDETFLEEEEEEGGNVTNIIGGPVAEGEEEV